MGRPRDHKKEERPVFAMQLTAFLKRSGIGPDELREALNAFLYHLHVRAPPTTSATTSARPLQIDERAMQNLLSGRVEVKKGVREAFDSLEEAFQKHGADFKGHFQLLSPPPLRIYGRDQILDNGRLADIQRDYGGNYICFYDDKQMDHGEETLHTRTYCLNELDQRDGSLYGHFSAVSHSGQEQLVGRGSGVIKFLFSPKDPGLVYVIELARIPDRPPVSGIVRAVQMGRDAFFYGILSGFRSEGEYRIIAVRSLILRESKVLRSDSLGAKALPRDIKENALRPEVWRLLKYYFNGFTKSNEDSTSSLYAPDQVRVVLANDQIHEQGVHGVVEQIYSGHFEGVCPAKASEGLNAYVLYKEQKRAKTNMTEPAPK